MTVDLSAASGMFNVEWMHPASGNLTRADAIPGGGKRTLKAPFTGDCVLYLRGN